VADLSFSTWLSFAPESSKRLKNEIDFQMPLRSMWGNIFDNFIEKQLGLRLVGRGWPEAGAFHHRQSLKYNPVGLAPSRFTT
jgi:hypothetical protein